MSPEERPPADRQTTPSPKPEGVDDPTSGTGQAIEPGSMHDLTGGARKAGDRMWGPPGVPGDDASRSPRRP